jgi:glucosamine--fructose-6-phosphate aminotransferase (isomerizing)
LKEVAGVAVEPYSAADFLHGPVAGVGRETVAVLVAPEGPSQPSTLRLVPELVARGATIVTLSDRVPLTEGVDLGFRLPCLPEWLSPLVAVVPGQTLALELARQSGLDPDLPSGLQKVTRTL